MVSLIADYLEKSQFPFSHSVFLPECGYSNGLLQRNELYDMLEFGEKKT